MEDVNEMINKSLEDIDAMADQLEKSNKKAEEDAVAKSEVVEEELSGEEISKDSEKKRKKEEEEEGTSGEGEYNEDAEDSDEEENIGDDEGIDEDTEKSLNDELSSNESVKKALEVSEFLQEFVKSFDITLNNQKDTLAKSIKESSDVSNMLLAKSIQGLVKSQGAISGTQAIILKGFDALNTRLDQIERQPSVRKSVSNANVVPVNKSFEASLGDSTATQTTQSNQLSKSQATFKLTQAFEKGNRDIMNDILALDSTGDFNVLSDEAKIILEQ